MKTLLMKCALLCALAACNGSGDEAPSAANGQAAADNTRATIAAARPTQTPPSAPPDHPHSAPRSNARDPGVRAAPSGAGAAMTGLNSNELAAFTAGQTDFNEVDEIAEGLGPTLNLDSCGGCHAHPAIGGSSPAVNPQLAFANRLGANNAVPAFLSRNGPIREARFVRNADGSPDGGVHALFTIGGRSDAAGCGLAQPDFAAALAQRNVIFRIPTPLFGAGLIEQIPDREILANMAKDAGTKRSAGVRGRANIMPPFHAISAQPNKNGNDGTLGRFGWKAQNKSLLVFAGEAYNVEMGISNELFPNERDETEACQFATLPNNVTDLEAATPIEALSAIEKFAIFMRLLAPAAPSSDTPGGRASVAAGKICSAASAARFATRPRCAPATPRWPRCATSAWICTPTCSCTTWAGAWPTASPKGRPGRASSAPRRCGAWGSACFSCTTGAPRICAKRCWRTRAKARRRAA